MAFRTGNPALKQSAFDDALARDPGQSAQMTLQGAVNKSALLVAIVMAVAGYWMYGIFSYAEAGNIERISTLESIGYAMIFVGLLLVVVLIFRKTWAPTLAPLYALVEGAVIGTISARAEMAFPGIVLQAVGLTFGVFLMLLFAYTSGLIKATENFKLMVVSATGGILLIYLAQLGLSLFTDINIPFIHDSGWMGIGFSAFVIVVASLNLVLDFDFIEHGAEAGAPKYMEWYAAFGLLVTLIWLYIEILRLLIKLRGR